MDLSSLESIRKFAGDIEKEGIKVNILVNNAGESLAIMSELIIYPTTLKVCKELKENKKKKQMNYDEFLLATILVLPQIQIVR